VSRFTLQQGHIIWATVYDQAGRNPKCRPAVVLTATSEIGVGPVACAAVTSRFSLPLPEHKVELPWSPGRHPQTGLYLRCVAVCDWLLKIAIDDVISVGGTVPPAELQEILAQVSRFRK
jgi:mRNA-degrading endonuclease toxin of MazEF toxin-antitoxin module